MKTVASHPRTIFVCSVITVLISFILISLVRLPKENDRAGEPSGDVEEQDENS